MGIVGFRVLMVIGMISGWSGLIAGVTSSNAVNIAKSEGDKNKAAGGAAGSFLLAGILVLWATSWAANKIVKQYKNLNIGGIGMGAAVSDLKIFYKGNPEFPNIAEKTQFHDFVSANRAETQTQFV